MLTKKIYNVETNETQELPLSESEIKELAAEDKLLKIKLDAFTKSEAEKQAAQAKLTALGLTAEDLKALGL